MQQDGKNSRKHRTDIHGRADDLQSVQDDQVTLPRPTSNARRTGHRVASPSYLFHS